MGTGRGMSDISWSRPSLNVIPAVLAAMGLGTTLCQHLSASLQVPACASSSSESLTLIFLPSLSSHFLLRHPGKNILVKQVPVGRQPSDKHSSCWVLRRGIYLVPSVCISVLLAPSPSERLHSNLQAACKVWN